MRINIYLEKQEKKKLLEIKEKYHLSISTIARIVTSVYYLMIPNDLEEQYIYGKTGYKTSIKPRKIGLDIKKLSLVYTNSLKIFCKGDLKNYVDQKKYEKSQNMIYKQFDEEWDEDWNGSVLQRNMPKYIKQNREYYKKDKYRILYWQG